MESPVVPNSASDEAVIDATAYWPESSITLAAAVDGDATFGDVGPLELTLRTGEGEVVARSTLDAATEERSLVLASLYLRNGTWRFRAVGQGYAEGLAHLAVLHGVDIED